MADVRSFSLHTGAAAVQVLIARIADKGNSDVAAYWAANPDDAVTDGRDYRALCELVQASIEENLHHQRPGHREGYLRALTDLLTMVGDGCAPGEGDDWRPISNTARSFEAADS